MAVSNFTFLTVDGTGRPSDPSSRAAIRSRCMKGVNVRQDSRRSKRKAKKTKERKENVTQTDIEDILVTHRQELAYASLSESLPTQMCMSIDDIGFNSSLLPPSVLQMAYQDKSILTALSMASSAVTDLTINTHLSSKTQQLLCNMLSTLNQGLHQAVKQQSPTTVLTILILLFTAEAMHDFDAMGAHLEGVGRLLIIRDRLPTGWDAKLLFKIQQFDLRLALATGRPLRLALEFPYSTVPTTGTSNILLKLGVSSPKIIEAFQNLQALTQHATESMSMRISLIWEDLQSQVSTIQTQLLSLEEGDLSDTEEALRLGILAFLTTLSLSPIRRLHLPRFCNQLETSYTLQHNSKAFTIWLMMMGMLSTVEVSNRVLRDLWDGIVDTNLSWPDAREMIGDEQLPWIGFIHDEPAKKVFNRLQASRSSAKSSQESNYIVLN
ncbi:hypothetical protein FIE12Z_4394 [Fusarium flagelliforme]|uniref:Uncharacterized protein n=1 Tax=Fusarium flagelliforme TaxID=2675880 RepID=A0A395MUB2_9HYPO|nr:hypothetical protein FIE12Z_4394 [Fusarium flagelliforme]